MASVHHYPATPSPVIPDGLQSRADWGVPSPISPPPYTPISYDSRYELHGNFPNDCLHARLMCEQRFATLEALMVDLERSQCRCGRSTWCRTKSFWGSIKKRALSIRSLKKSQSSPEKEQERDPESPAESRPTSPAKELSDTSRVELSPQHISELAACTPQRRNAYLPLTTFHANLPGDSSSRYKASSGMPLPLGTVQQPRAPSPGIFELPAPLPNTPSPIRTPYTPSHITTPYGNTPGKSLTSVSLMSDSSASSHAKSSLVSPQSSISSISTAPSTKAAPVTSEVPLFAAHTTYSPVEYDQDDDISPWDKHPNTAQGGLWASTSTVAELPASFPEPAFNATPWLQEQGPPGSILQPSKVVSFNPHSEPSLHQSSGRTESLDSFDSPAQAAELPGSVASPISGPSASRNKRPISLENVRRTFCELRQNPAWQGVSVASLSQLRDSDALLVAIDELENLRQGQNKESVLSKLSFAYLALAMAVEMGDVVSLSDHVILNRGMGNFVRSDGESGLPDGFLDVANAFLYTLHAQIDSDPDRLLILQRLGFEKRPTILALGFMRLHFRTYTPPRPRPQLPVSHARQHSWDSTTSTVLDVVIYDDTHSAIPPAGGFHPVQDSAISGLPSQQRPIKHRPSTLKRAGRRHSVSCSACGFYPAEGPDQRKKMDRHKLTDKHRRNTGQDEAGEAEVYPCHVCGSRFNRRDNLRQHIKKHGDQRSAAESRERKHIWRTVGQSLHSGRAKGQRRGDE